MPDAVILRRVDPGRNMARFYRMDIQPDLFGEWRFVREWGRIGQAGQVRQAVYPSQAAAKTALERHCRVKEKRGYVYVISEIGEEPMAYGKLNEDELKTAIAQTKEAIQRGQDLLRTVAGEPTTKGLELVTVSTPASHREAGAGFGEARKGAGEEINHMNSLRSIGARVPALVRAAGKRA